jgi:hypothetical protein
MPAQNFTLKVRGAHPESLAANLDVGGERRRVAPEPQFKSGDTLVACQAGWDIRMMAERLRCEDDCTLNEPYEANRASGAHQRLTVPQRHSLKEGPQTALLGLRQTGDEQILWHRAPLPGKKGRWSEDGTPPAAPKATHRDATL